MPRIKTKVFGKNFKLLDARLATPRYPNYAYAAPSVTTGLQWSRHAKWVRERVLLAGGLTPEPERTPLKARVYGRVDLDGYSVEKVRFESRPGFLVTGNLFRPIGRRGRRPAILCPHGHWLQGRMEDSADGSIHRRCAMLARLGFIVLNYDMVGYNDSCQIEHRWPAETLQRSLLYGIGPFGLQLWNSIRAADFLCGLPDANPKRLGCTGASGGATQTYYFACVDRRIRVVAPVCMMSAHYQGGCTCEEPPLVHLGDLTTLDVVGSLAPRPVLLPSVTQDWTNQNPAYDVPALRRIYALYNAADHVGNVHLDAPHNYNQDTREHVYAWFRRWLTGDRKAPRRIREPKLVLPTREQARLFPDGRPPRRVPRGSKLLARLARSAMKPFASPPRSLADLRKLRATWTSMYRDVLGAHEPKETVSAGTYLDMGKTDSFTVSARTIGRYGRGEQTPGLWIVPAGAGTRAPAALIVTESGKAELFSRGKPSSLLAAMLRRGVRVLAIDMIGKGETRPLLARESLSRSDPIFYAFNPSLTAHRVQEILTSLAALRQHDKARRPALVGVGLGGVVALLTRPLAGALSSTTVDLKGCKTSSDRFWMGETYHPLIRKAGDVRAALALAPASPLLLARAEPELAKWARAVYRSQSRSAALRLSGKAPGPRAVAAWVR